MAEFIVRWLEIGSGSGNFSHVWYLYHAIVVSIYNIYHAVRCDQTLVYRLQQSLQQFQI